MPNRPTNSEARKFHDEFEKFGKVLQPAERNGPARSDYNTVFEDDPKFKADHPRYPDFVYPDDTAADTRTQALFATADFFGAQSVIKQTPKDVDYLMKKKEARALLDFKQFVEDSLPRGTPWEKKNFEKFMPGWHESKVGIINKKIEFLKRLKDITMYGPKSQDDMFILYQIYTGQIDVPETIEEVIHGVNQTVPTNQFHSGKYNPKRFVDKKVYVTRRNQEYMANFSIPGIDPKGIAVLVGTDLIDPEVQRQRSNLIVREWSRANVETQAYRNWRNAMNTYTADRNWNAANPRQPQRTLVDPGAAPTPQFLNITESDRYRIDNNDVDRMFRLNDMTAQRRSAQLQARQAGYIAGAEFDSHFRKIETTRDPPAYSGVAWDTRGTRGWTAPGELSQPGGNVPGGTAWNAIPGRGSTWNRVAGFRRGPMIGNVMGVRTITNPDYQILRDVIRGDRAVPGGHNYHPF